MGPNIDEGDDEGHDDAIEGRWADRRLPESKPRLSPSRDLKRDDPDGSTNHCNQRPKMERMFIIGSSCQ